MKLILDSILQLCLICGNCIRQTAKRLNVQVFATTHNSDCWKSLADIAEQEEATEDGIRIHRIERGKNTNVVFIEPEIVIAAEENIEVR